MPKAIRLDNGPELTAPPFTNWCAGKGIDLRHIQLGKPNQNAFIKRFDRSYRTKVINSWLFESLDQVGEINYDWIRSYNEQLPHDTLGNLPPAVYRKRLVTRENLLPNYLLDGVDYAGSFIKKVVALCARKTCIGRAAQ